MLLAATDLLKPTVPVWAGTAVAVAAAVACFLFALTIVGFARAIGGIVGAGAGLVAGSGLLPWISGTTPAGQNFDLDAWKKGAIFNNSFTNSVKVWTGVGPTTLQWGIPLAVAGLLMLILGVLPGRLGLLAIVPSLLVPYSLLYELKLKSAFRLDVKNVGVGAWAALAGSALVLLTVIIRALQAPSRRPRHAQPAYAQPYPQPNSQPGYGPPPGYGQAPGYGEPQPGYGYPDPQHDDDRDHGHDQPAANDGATVIMPSPLWEPPYQQPRER